MLHGTDVDAIGKGGSSKRLAAFREIQAKRAAGGVIDAGDVAIILAHQRDRAAARAAGEPLPTVAAAAPKARAPAAPKITGAHVQAAEDRGKSTERKRWADVFASEASRGKEQACATLLANSANWSAAQILKNLAAMPTDTARADMQRAAKAKAGAAVWDRALASINPRKN